MTDFIRRNPVASFFVLALAISCIAFIHFYFAGGETVALFTFGPFVAAVIVGAIVEGWLRVRVLLRSIVHWRGAPIGYLVAIGFPILAQLLANVIPHSAPSPQTRAATASVGQIAVTVAVLAIFSGPLGEEPGWRGFALPELMQRHAEVSASLIVGVVWSTWHLPLTLHQNSALSGSRLRGTVQASNGNGSLSQSGSPLPSPSWGSTARASGPATEGDGWQASNYHSPRGIDPGRPVAPC